MALTDENGSGNGMVMPVAPLYGNGGYNNGGFGFGGDGAWLLLFILLCGGGFGGWGGFGGGMWGPMMSMGMMDGGWGLYPWLNNSEHISDGFRDQQLNTSVQGIQNAVTSGFGDVQLGIAGVNQNICQTGNGIQNALCQGFAGTTAAVTAAQNGITQQLYNNEIASLNRSFAEQTANTAAVNGISRQLSDCCCENRLQTQGLQSTIISENCADREALNNGVRDILANQTSGIQRILDKLCDQELQAERRENDNLRSQLNMANLAASQTAQTSRLLADNAAQTQAIENYVRPQINPAYVVPNPYAYNYFPGWRNGNNCDCNGNGFVN